MRIYATGAAAAALMLSATAVTAADLGGSCCADLEERIAELEATTASKGNRKVALTIYGFINEAVMIWDDGFEDNAFVVTNDNGRSRVGFRGDAKIADGWKAGFRYELGIRTQNSKRFTQDEKGVGGLDTRHALWYIDSKTYGRISMGQTGGAGEGSTEQNLAKTFDVAKFSDPEDVGLGLLLRRTDGTLVEGFNWYRLLRDYGDQPGEGRRFDLVKYETPVIAGFSGVASWGEDDTWELGLRFKGEGGGFKMAAAMAYGENTEERVGSTPVGFQCLAQGTQVPADGPDALCNQFGASASVMHTDTGLYANVAYGQSKDELVLSSSRFAGVAGAEDTSWFWATEAGIETKFFPVGTTTLFAQYYYDEGGSNARRTIAEGRILDTELSYWGFGVVQMLDPAAMELYLYYRHHEAGLTALSGSSGAGTRTTLDLEDLDVVTAGALIRF